MKVQQSVILFTTHLLDEYIIAQYRKLRSETVDLGLRAILLAQEDTINREDVPDDIDCYWFSVESLNELDYEPIEETIVPGSNHFATLQFYKAHPDYAYYWTVEFDVCFSGNWQTFFEAFEDVETDFLSTHIQRIDENRSWPWWHSLYPTSDLTVPRTEYIKSFNPIYRLSNAAIAKLDELLTAGHRGHHELLVPTLLAHFGFSLGDFGGTGSFVLPAFEERFYTGNHPLDSWYQESTMRYRPLLKVEDMQILNKIYHPIKHA